MIVVHVVAIPDDIDGDDPDEQGEHAQGSGKETQREVGDEQHGKDHGSDHEGAAEVRFGKDQQHGQPHGKGQFYEHLERIGDRTELGTGQDRSRDEEHGHLGEFGGLERDPEAADPAPGAHAVGGADPGDEYEQQQHDADHIDPMGIPEPDPVIQKRGREVKGTTENEVGGLVLPLGAVARQLRAVDEKDAKQAQHHHASRRDPVELLARGELEKAGQVEVAQEFHEEKPPLERRKPQVTSNKD